MLRRTKILATLGPATDKPGVLEGLFKAGIDVVRMNFSHGSAQDHLDRAEAVRAMSREVVAAHSVAQRAPVKMFDTGSSTYTQARSSSAISGV